MRIDSYASPSAADNYPNGDGDSYSKQHTTSSHRNAVTDSYAHACAEI